MSVELLPHNKRAYENVRTIFETSNRVAVVHPTGTGKSFIALKLIEDNKDKKIIYLSPSVPIMNQLKKNIIETGTYCQDLQRITYQKLTAMSEENREKLQADIIILDEFHHCGAPEWGKAVEELIKTNPNAKILGLSATPMRYFDGEVRDMAEELFDGNIASEMSLAEAIATGVLSEPDYTTGLYEYEDIIKELEEKWQKLSDSEKEKNAKQYQENMQLLKTMLDSSVKGLPELLANKMTNKTGRYIVYCKDIKDMQKKMQEAQEMFSRVNPEMSIMSISSRDEDVRINARTIREFEKGSDDGKLKLLFSVNMLNEGYHLKDLDGVIMMRPTHSPTLYYQQLGRALSVGDGKQPIVIDLVNNIDTIEIIEGFSKSLGEAKTRNSNTKVSMRTFSISEGTRKIKEVVDKIDKLVQRRTDYLTFQEKYELMTEYMRETGEEIKIDTKYKGYNIGTMKSNLRHLYFSGTLKMDEELLRKFKECGIISEKKERSRTTQQEKYEFLMQLIGKSRDELYHAKMDSGLSFADAKNSLQIEYNRGTLRLTTEQIENLRKHGFLGYSRDEQEQIAEKMGLPRKYAVDIIRKYGSYEEFMQQYKIGTIDYKFGNDVFCGYRGITISEQEMTEEQKLRWAILVEDIPGLCDMNFEDGYYIDIDKLKNVRDLLEDRDKEYIELYYGLNGEKLNTTQIGKKYDRSVSGVSARIRHILHQFSSYQQKDNFIGNVKIKLQQYESKKRDIEECMRELDALVSYITDENGNPKEQVKNISLKKLGFCDDEHYRKDKDVLIELVGEKRKDNIRSLKDVMAIIYIQEEERRIRERRRRVEKKLTHIEEVDFSVRTYNCLIKGNIRTINELVLMNEDELMRIRNMGRKSLEEIKQKLAERDLQLGQPIVIDEESKDETMKSDIEILLQRCNLLLESYRWEIKQLEEYKKEKLEPEVAKYNEAKDNYLNRENILDPNGIVPAVKRNREAGETYMKTNSRRNKFAEKLYINTAIEELDFTVRTFNNLKRANINTVFDIIQQSEDDLRKVRNMGKKSLDEIKQKIEKRGLRLRQEETQDMEEINSDESAEMEEVSGEEVSATTNIEDMTIEELEQENQNVQSKIQDAKGLLEQKKKEALIRSITEGKQELEKLKELLASLGISLDD